MKLSLLVCSLEARAFYLNRLKECIFPQIRDRQDQVEVLVCMDKGELTIGQKRNLLLEQAKGDYIAFIDDDDTVVDRYVSAVLNAIQSNPDVVGMRLLMYTDGQNPQLSTHSLQYKTWWDEPDPEKPWNKRYYRNPNHLNPVKREHALKTKFPHSSMGEDRDYSHRILPLLKTEEMIDWPIYYYWVRTQKEC